jgi:hypothetical protein
MGTHEHTYVPYSGIGTHEHMYNTGMGTYEHTCCTCEWAHMDTHTVCVQEREKMRKGEKTREIDPKSHATKYTHL